MQFHCLDSESIQFMQEKYLIGFENLLGSVYVGQWKKGHRHGLGRLLFGPLHSQQAGEILTSIWNYDSNQKQISIAKVNDWMWRMCVSVLTSLKFLWPLKSSYFMWYR